MRKILNFSFHYSMPFENLNYENVLCRYFITDLSLVVYVMAKIRNMREFRCCISHFILLVFCGIVIFMLLNDVTGLHVFLL